MGWEEKLRLVMGAMTLAVCQLKRLILYYKSMSIAPLQLTKKAPAITKLF